MAPQVDDFYVVKFREILASLQPIKDKSKYNH